MKTITAGVRLTAVVVAIIMLLSLSGCGFPISLCPLPDPADAVEGFVAAYHSGDGELLAEYIYKYDPVNLNGLDDSEYHKKLFQLMRDNLAITLEGEATVSGKDASLPVEVTCFDFRKLSAVLSESTTAAALEYSKQNIKFEDEDSVMVLLCEVVDELTADPSAYRTSEKMTLTLHYDSGWRVCIDDALYSVLIGHIS